MLDQIVQPFRGSIHDQVKLNFYVIPFFDALTDWFSLRQVRTVNESQGSRATGAAMGANQKRWIRKLHKKVADYIEAAQIIDRREFCTVSADHAKELLRFRDWLQSFLDQGSGSPTLACEIYSCDF